MRAALACSRVSDEDLDDTYFYAFQLGNDVPADAQDERAALPAKFRELAFGQRGLENLGDMQNLVRCGVDYMFTSEGNKASLSAFFSPAHLLEMQRAQEGETERIKEKKLDEKIPKGYAGVNELLRDQKSIYTHPFHQ